MKAMKVRAGVLNPLDRAPPSSLQSYYSLSTYSPTYAGVCRDVGVRSCQPAGACGRVRRNQIKRAIPAFHAEHRNGHHRQGHWNGADQGDADERRGAPPRWPPTQ